MKIKKGFVCRAIADQYVVVALGETSKQFNGIIQLNETGAFLFNTLKDEHTEEELLNLMLNEYDVTSEIAKRDIHNFIEILKKEHLLDGE